MPGLGNRNTFRLDTWNFRNFKPEFWFNASSRNRVYHLYKSVPFTKQWPRNRVTSINHFEEMEHKFPFGAFRSEKQGHLFRCFFAPKCFPPGVIQRGVFHLLPNRVFRKLFANCKQPTSRREWLQEFHTLMTCHYPDLGSTPDWSKQISLVARPIGSTNKIWVVTRHQYGISALVPQTSFCAREISGSVAAKCGLFSQASMWRSDWMSTKPLFVLLSLLIFDRC